jgi:uncharacterized membrane protein (UPF0182 family)
MYFLVLVLLVAAGLWTLWRGIERSSRGRIIGGVAIIAVTAGVFGLMSLWGEMLWFGALGLQRRFWLFLGAHAGTAAVAAAAAVAVAGAITWTLPDRRVRNTALLVAALGGAGWGAGSWSELLVFINRVASGMTDPVFAMDTGFFLFALPFYDRLYGLAVYSALVGTGAGLVALLLRSQATGSRPEQVSGDRVFPTLLTGSTVLAAVLAAGQVLNAWHLVFSDLGVVRGAGWTDVHIRLPAYLGMAVLLLLLATLLLSSRLRQWLSRRLARFTTWQAPALNALLALWVTLGTLWILLLGGLPTLVQWLVVEPNEITFERPYLKRNIDFTLHGFHLDKVEERQFPASEELPRATVDSNQDLLAEVRLWDWRALDAVYKQFQEIRLYYEFVDVDIDRYTFGGRYRQVMVSARELDQENLAAQSRTFVNQRFKYTHGYGLTLATVSDFTPEGLPNLLVRDIPPQSSFPELAVNRPQIYYGELTRTPVVVNSAEAEFDYPSGESNRYIHYPGQGGVLLDSFWRKLLFGWKFDGARLLFSGYPRADSRIMFHREVHERVRQIAPFLEFDEDPYIVLVNGRLYWIIDAYTTSTYLPYSEPFSSREFIQYRNEVQSSGYSRRTADDLNGINYVRNSVKVVVDAFEGGVDFYVFEPQDPIIQVWRRILPEVFRSAADMPDGLRKHVRYPQDFLLVQGLVYAKYHMHNPEVFYNQEDLWVRATEKHYDRVQPVEPYYVMWELPGSDRVEFVLIQPFTPRNRQVLIGWIAGLSDGANYGRFIAYQFPKERRVLGPQQVETKIDQDSFLSGQLTLWDQRGSNVIRGNVLAIPLDDTILYVEPIYLQAETAAYPELRLVVVMHGDNMSYAESLDAALEGLFAAQPLARQAGVLPALTSVHELGKLLNDTFSAWLEALGERRFEAASARLKELSELIEQAATAQEALPPGARQPQDPVPDLAPTHE